MSINFSHSLHESSQEAIYDPVYDPYEYFNGIGYYLYAILFLVIGFWLYIRFMQKKSFIDLLPIFKRFFVYFYLITLFGYFGGYLFKLIIIFLF